MARGQVHRLNSKGHVRRVRRHRGSSEPSPSAPGAVNGPWLRRCFRCAAACWGRSRLFWSRVRPTWTPPSAGEVHCRASRREVPDEGLGLGSWRGLVALIAVLGGGLVLAFCCVVAAGSLAGGGIRRRSVEKATVGAECQRFAAPLGVVLWMQEREAGKQRLLDKEEQVRARKGAVREVAG